MVRRALDVGVRREVGQPIDGKPDGGGDGENQDDQQRQRQQARLPGQHAPDGLR